MFAHRINVLTHDLKHQCRIADVSRCNNTPLDKHGNMASDPPVAAPYLQGKILLIPSACCISYLLTLYIDTCRKFSDFYDLKEIIGTGGFGSVYGGICKANKQQVRFIQALHCNWQWQMCDS